MKKKKMITFSTVAFLQQRISASDLGICGRAALWGLWFRPSGFQPSLELRVTRVCHLSRPGLIHYCFLHFGNDVSNGIRSCATATMVATSGGHVCHLFGCIYQYRRVGGVETRITLRQWRDRQSISHSRMIMPSMWALPRCASIHTVTGEEGTGTERISTPGGGCWWKGEAGESLCGDLLIRRVEFLRRVRTQQGAPGWVGEVQLCFPSQMHQLPSVSCCIQSTLGEMAGRLLSPLKWEEIFWPCFIWTAFSWVTTSTWPIWKVTAARKRWIEHISPWEICYKTYFSTNHRPLPLYNYHPSSCKKTAWTGYDVTDAGSSGFCVSAAGHCTNPLSLKGASRPIGLRGCHSEVFKDCVQEGVWGKPETGLD